MDPLAIDSKDESVFVKRPDQTPEVFKQDLVTPVELHYLLSLPDGYDDPARKNEKWPLLLFLHGVGECGTDLERVKAHGPPKLIAAGKKLPMIVVSPQTAKLGWVPLELNALLDDLEKRLRVDETRVYLTGLSMGGFGTWATASARPDRFAAIVPICGGGDWLGAQRLRSVPTWIFHGRLDPVVPVDESERMARTIEKAGGKPKLTIYDDLGHDCWTRAYDDPALWEWIAAQGR
jgi:predicted peptidase